MARSGNRSGGSGWRVVFWISMIVCLAAVSALGFILYSYWSASHGYEQIADVAFSADDVAAGSVDATTLGEMTVDWDYLRSINPDVVAWVYMPGTAINYPVVHTTDNDKYLQMDFNQQNGFSARCGTIFLDCANDGGFTDANSVLYGHHMNDGSMFAAISKQLPDNDEFNTHRTIYVLTPEANYQCETFALVITDGYEAIVSTNFESEDERVGYILDKEARSVVSPSEGMPDPTQITKLFTFSTCDYNRENGRAILFSQVVNTATPGSEGGVEVSEGDLATMQDAAEAA